MKQGALLRDPTAETSSELRPRQAPLDTFSGNTVALMDIGKMRGDEFIDRLEVLCRQRGIATRRYKKPTNTREQINRCFPRNTYERRFSSNL